MSGVGYERDGRVAVITYDRPEALNAIDGEMRAALNAAFARFRDDTDAWVGIVAAEGLAAARERRAPRWQGR